MSPPSKPSDVRERGGAGSSAKMRRVAVVAATIGGLVALVPRADGQVLDDVVVERVEQCSADDLPEAEGQLQGDIPRADQESGRAKQGYNCGLSLVGHTPIWKNPTAPEPRAPRVGNANMAWAGHCAYVAGPGAVFGPPNPEIDWGVAVVDVADPSAPRHVRTLRTPGALATLETLHAVETSERSLLVVGQYGNVGTSNVPMDVYDVSDCAEPVLLQTFRWPENIHNLTIAGNGRYVFGTQPLQVADLAPLFDGDPETEMTYLGNLEKQLPFPLVPVEPGPDLDDDLPPELREARRSGDTSSMAHEAWPSHDGTTLYVGGVTIGQEAVTIADLTQWLARDEHGQPLGPPEVISQRGGRAHSIRTATVHQEDGTSQRLLLHSEEAVFGTAKGCFPEDLNPFAGPAEPWLTDITDEADPVAVSQFGLEINRREHCLDQMDSDVDASTHYHDVDDPDDTTFAMVSMWNAGLRVFDIRDPERPVEVAYFNPGDVGIDSVVLDRAWGHVRWVRETGHIWFATSSGGFWVVELAPQVRTHLGLDAPTAGPGSEAGSLTAVRPNGHPGTAGAARTAPAALAVDLRPAWCTLGPLPS